MGNLQKISKSARRFLPCPPKRITWGAELATGYDRLKYGLYVTWEKIEVLNQLADAKEKAKEENGPVTISFTEHGDMVFNAHPTGRKGGYAFHISRSDVNIFFSTRKDHTTPNVWVDIGSLSCWSPGYQAITEEVENLIHHLGGHIVKNVVSEVHLCADFIGLDLEELPIDRYDHWITRANRFHCYQDRAKFSGITLTQNLGELPEGDRASVMIRESGITFGSGDIMLRIYDKTLELKRNPTKQSVFASVWQKENFDDQPVTRVEYQLRRDVLKQMKVDSLRDLQRKRAGVWRYCTMKWTRFSLDPVDRHNRHQDRAIMHPWWKEVQGIDFKTPLVEIVRAKVQSSKDLKGLAKLAAGCTLTMGAILNLKPDNLEEVIATGQGLIESTIRQMFKEKTPTGQNLFKHKMRCRWAEVWPMGYQPNMAAIEWAMG